MEYSFFIFIGFVLLILFYFFNKNERNKIAYEFKKISENFNLNYYEKGFGAHPGLSGNYNNINFEIQIYRENKKNIIKLKASFNLDKNLNFIFANENSLTNFGKYFGYNDILIGDNYFDEEINVKSDKKYVAYALLNNSQRRDVLELNYSTNNFEITDSHIMYKVNCSLKNIETINLNIKRISKIVDNLRSKIKIKQRLIDNILKEDQYEIKYKNYIELLCNFRIDDEIKKVINKLFEGDNRKLKIESARYLDEKGCEFLKGLLDKFGDLTEKEILKSISILKEQKYTESTGTLKKLYLNINNELIKIEVLDTFKSFADEKLSLFLTDQLKEKSTEILIKIIDTLSTCGNIKAVEKMYNISKHSINPVLKNHIQKSIASIQSKLGNVDNGMLTVSEFIETEGALSVDDDGEMNGMLSEAEKS